MKKHQTINVQFPEYVTWMRDVPQSAESSLLFSSKTLKRIRAAKRRLAEHNLKFKIEPVTKQFIDLFVPLYQNHMQDIGGTAHDVRDKVLLLLLTHFLFIR